MPLPVSADVVVVGGGAIGASVAYHLALLGRRDVVVLERARRAGEGSTGRATGGYRAQFATAVNVRLSLLARETLRRFDDEFGVDSGYRAVGYLWLARDQATLAMLRTAQRVQHAAGLAEATEVTPADVARLNPAVVTDDLVGGVFCPTDGYIRPLEILRGFTEGAQRLGACVHYGVAVTGCRRQGDRIEALETTAGTIRCGEVVNAAGAWAAALGAMAGVTVPVTPLRRQVALTEPTDCLPPDMPMTIMADDGFHLRVRDGRVLYAWPTPGDPADPFDACVDPAWLDEVERKAHARVPALAAVPLDRAHCWGGLYEVSPDKLAIVGRAPGCANLVLANGSSGHGVMHSPAIGRLVAELMTQGRATSVDIAELSPERFAGGVDVAAREFL